MSLFKQKFVENLVTDLAAKIPLTQKAAANGVATLDAGGKVPAAQLPNSLMEYLGTWDASTNTPTISDAGKASKVIQDLTYTAVTAGTSGNDISIAYTSGGTAGSEVVTVTGNAISVQIESGVSTATQVKDAVDNNVDAAALVVVTISGTGSNAQTTVSATSLVGGADAGSVYIVSVGGTINLGSGAITFVAGDWAIYNGTIWQKSINSNAVASVNGKTGAVVLTESDIQYLRQTSGEKKNIAEPSEVIGLAIDNLDDAIGALDQTPTNYTPTNPAIVADHLEAIDGVLADVGTTSFEDSTFEIKNTAAPTKKGKFDASAITAGATRTVTFADRAVDLDNVTSMKTEVLTLDSTDITNKYKDLTIASDVKGATNTCSLTVVGGPLQIYGTDYAIVTDGSLSRRVSWDGRGLDGVLESGDKLIVSFLING